MNAQAHRNFGDVQHFACMLPAARVHIRTYIRTYDALAQVKQELADLIAKEFAAPAAAASGASSSSGIVGKAAGASSASGIGGDAGVPAAAAAGASAAAAASTAAGASARPAHGASAAASASAAAGAGAAKEPPEPKPPGKATSGIATAASGPKPGDSKAVPPPPPPKGRLPAQAPHSAKAGQPVQPRPSAAVDEGEWLSGVAARVWERARKAAAPLAAAPHRPKAGAFPPPRGPTAGALPPPRGPKAGAPPPPPPLASVRPPPRRPPAAPRGRTADAPADPLNALEGTDPKDEADPEMEAGIAAPPFRGTVAATTFGEEDEEVEAPSGVDSAGGEHDDVVRWRLNPLGAYVHPASGNAASSSSAYPLLATPRTPPKSRLPTPPSAPVTPPELCLPPRPSPETAELLLQQLERGTSHTYVRMYVHGFLRKCVRTYVHEVALVWGTFQHNMACPR